MRSALVSLVVVSLLATAAGADEEAQQAAALERLRQAEARTAAGDDEGALVLLRQVLADFPEDDGLLSRIAQALVNLGRIDEARDIYRRCARLAAARGARVNLAIHHQSLVQLAALYPPELMRSREAAAALPDTPKAHSALAEFGPLAQQGANQMAAGHIEQARELLERALQVAREGFGPEHPSTLWAQNMLADARRVRGDAKGARPLYQAAVAGCAKRLGPDHPDCLTYRNNLATCLRELGRNRQALTQSREVWETSRRVLGENHLLTVLYQGELGMALIPTEEVEQAVELLRRADEVCTGLLSASHVHCLALRAKLGQAAWNLGLYNLARDTLDGVVTEATATLEPNHPLVGEAQALRDKLRATHEDVEGKVLDLEKTRKRLQRARKTKDPRVAAVAEQLAEAYEFQGRLQEALPLRREVLAARRGAEADETLQALTALGDLLLQLGRPQEARPLFEQAYRAGLRRRGPRHPDALVLTGNLGHALFACGELTRARELLEPALAAARETLSEDSDVSLSLLNNLGLVLSAQGEQERARELYTAAWQSLRRLAGEDYPDTLRARHNLAQTLRNLGLLAEAEDHARAALDGRTRMLGRAHPQTLYSLHGLGAVQLDRGHLAEARLSLEEALRLRREVIGERHPETLNTLASLARLRAAEGHQEEARALMEEAAGRTAEALGPDHPRTLELQAAVTGERLSRDAAGHLAELAALTERCHRLLGDGHELTVNLDFSLVHTRFEISPAPAELGALGAAFERARAVLGPSHPLTMQMALETSLALLKSDRPAEAEALAEPVWEREQQRGEPTSELARRSLNLRALAALARGDLAGGLEHLRQLTRLNREWSEALLWAADETTRASLVGWIAESSEWLAGLYLAFGGPEAGRLALELAYEQKGLALRVAGEVTAGARALSSPAGADAERELAELRRELGERLSAGPRGAPAEEHRARIEDLRRAVTEREVRLAQAVGGQRPVGSQPAFSAAAATLGRDGALVEFLVILPQAIDPKTRPARRLAAAVLAPGASPETGLVDLGPLAELEDRIRALRELLGRPASGAPSAELTAATRELYNRLWRPLEPWLRERPRVAVVPDGVVWLAPLAALRDERGYLAERVELTVLGSSQELLPRAENAPDTAAGPVVVLADPDFGASQAPAGVVPAAVGLAGLRFAPLPSTADEGERVTARFIKSGRAVLHLRGAQATEGALRRLHRPELLHLATHGFLLKDRGRPAPDPQPSDELVALLRGGGPAPRDALPGGGGARPDPLVRAGLALAQANPGVRGRLQPDGHDGVLLALEALDLDLAGCRLVVLSACESGLGDVQQGEGVAGLRRAFLQAGARSVLSTLWPISDEGTRVFMDRFYDRLLAGESAPQALTRVQRELLGDPTLSHPFFWAPFLITGR